MSPNDATPIITEEEQTYLEKRAWWRIKLATMLGAALGALAMVLVAGIPYICGIISGQVVCREITMYDFGLILMRAKELNIVLSTVFGGIGGGVVGWRINKAG